MGVEPTADWPDGSIRAEIYSKGGAGSYRRCLDRLVLWPAQEVGAVRDAATSQVGGARPKQFGSAFEQCFDLPINVSPRPAQGSKPNIFTSPRIMLESRVVMPTSWA